MKLVILEGSFNGYYASAKERVVLPIEAAEKNIYGELKEGIYKDAVDFGELEGKHSECYGDLVIKYVDTDEMNQTEIMELVNGLDEANYIESFLERNGIEWWEENVSGDEQKQAIANKKTDDFTKSVGVKDGYIYHVPGKFLETLKEKYVISTKEIIVKETDYDKAINLLKEKGIELF